MAAIIRQHDKRSGRTYVYESISRWDKEKQQSRATRRLIGRLDPATGDIVPTDGRNRQKTPPNAAPKPGPVPAENTARYFYGATYLLDSIGEQLGITQDLKRCFPETYRQILSTVYYLVLEDHTPLYRFEKWGSLHKHPYGNTITSQRSSELFAGISDAARQQFFLLQGKRRIENEYLVYDTTSISSYSEQLRQVQYGKNKENDLLPQLNVALVYGETSGLPFYYRKLAGNIPDSKTLKHLLAELATLGFKKTKLVMDRGFYSEENINALLKDHIKFLMAGKMSLRFTKTHLDGIYTSFRSFDHYDDTYELYHHTVQVEWSYTQDRPYKRDTLKAKRRMYIHYYYDIEQAAENEKGFDKKLMGLKQELESGQPVPEHDHLYKKYFEVNATPKRGVKVAVKGEAVVQAKKYFGFFCLLSNEKMGAIQALERYRNKDLVEKAFGNLKERLNLRRTVVSSEQSLEGKLFVEFVALIYLSHIKKRMQLAQMFKTYTLQGALDKLDVIECFEAPGQQMRVGEILEKQKEIYRNLGVTPPASL